MQLPVIPRTWVIGRSFQELLPSAFVRRARGLRRPVQGHRRRVVAAGVGIGVEADDSCDAQNVQVAVHGLVAEMRADGRRLLRELEALALERPLDRIEEARRREVFGGARRLWSGEGRSARGVEVE